MNKFYTSLIFVLTLLSFMSCDKDDEITKKSDSKQITEFALKVSTGSIKAIINEYEVSITIPKNMDISSLTPVIEISDKAAIFPLSNTVQDFTNPVSYTVTAEDGSKQVYIVTVVIEKSTDCSINEFSFNQLNPVVTGTISNTNIELIVPIGSDIKKLVPHIVISEDATISPESDIETDFSAPVVYTVVSEDKTEQKYTVVVNLEKSSENKILEFKFEDFEPALVGVIDNENNTINVTVPWAEKFDIYSMVPTITLSENATVNPVSGQENNFGIAQTYTVVAENEDARNYTVLVSIEEAPQPTIEPLTIKVYSKGDKISIKGSNFSQCEVYLKNNSNSNIMTLDSETTTEVTFTLPDNSLTPVGESELSIYIRGEEFKLGTITILPPAPSISSLSKSNSDDNVIVNIIGANFGESGNEVFFVQNQQEYKAYIKKETETKIEVILNPLLTPGDYAIRVKTFNKEVTSTETVEIVAPITTNPIITDVNKTSIKKGEKLIISGANLEGSLVQIDIVSDNGSLVRNAKSVSDTEIEYTIPNDIASGTYEISVQLYVGYDLMFSNVLYNIIITD